MRLTSTCGETILKDGLPMKKRAVNMRYIIELDEDNFLSNYRLEAAHIFQSSRKLNN